MQGYRHRVFGGQHPFQRAVHQRAAGVEILREVEAHRSSSSQASGLVVVAPLSSFTSSSIRRSASSRYFVHWRASDTPSSKTLSDSSSGRLPASSAVTICSSRVRQSSNLRSLIALLPLRHTGREATLVEHHADLVADLHLSHAAHDLAR